MAQRIWSQLAMLPLLVACGGSREPAEHPSEPETTTDSDVEETAEDVVEEADDAARELGTTAEEAAGGTGGDAVDAEIEDE